MKHYSHNRFDSFDWDKAKYFYYVIKFGSQTEAAKYLNITQPSLSRKLSLLEAELNCVLMHNNRGVITLSRKGQQLYKIIENSYLQLKEFSHHKNANQHNGKRHIRISTTHPIAAYILNEHILDYNILNPHITFEILANDELIDLTINDVDIAIRPYDDHNANVVQDHLFTLQKKLFASEAYINKYGEPKSVDELKHHHMIAHANPEKNPYSDLNWILKLGMPNGEMNQAAFLSNSLENAISAAEIGLGIIGCYEEMTIVKKANLKRILKDVKGSEIKDYISHPKFLNNDEETQKLKQFLLIKFNNKKS